MSDLGHCEPPDGTGAAQPALCVSDLVAICSTCGAGHMKCVSPFETSEGRVAHSDARRPWGWPLDPDLGHAGGTQPPNWTRQQTNPRSLTWGFIMERVTRIELALSAWEADVLPLNYTRKDAGQSRCRNAPSLYLIPGPGR